MVDTQRFNLGQGCVQTVSAVAREIARRHERASILEVATYLPLDVESVARIIDSLVEQGDAEAFDEDGVSYFTMPVDGLEPLDIGATDFISRSSAFERNLASLRNDDEWTRKVRGHHEVLHAIADAQVATMQLADFVDRTTLSSARVTSILNDFASQGYISVDVAESGPTYTVPMFDYPRERYDRVGGKVEELEERQSFRGSWIAIAIGAAILLVIVIVLRVI